MSDKAERSFQTYNKNFQKEHDDGNISPTLSSILVIQQLPYHFCTETRSDEERGMDPLIVNAVNS
jgi:hypothetical protein